MTLILCNVMHKHDHNIQMMHLCTNNDTYTEYEVSRSRRSKVRAERERHTQKHWTEKQDSTHYPSAMQVVRRDKMHSFSQQIWKLSVAVNVNNNATITVRQKLVCRLQIYKLMRICSNYSKYPSKMCIYKVHNRIHL